MPLLMKRKCKTLSFRKMHSFETALLFIFVPLCPTVDAAVMNVAFLGVDDSL